jgi:hypothetical protein
MSPTLLGINPNRLRIVMTPTSQTTEVIVYGPGGDPITTIYFDSPRLAEDFVLSSGIVDIQVSDGSCFE